MEMELATVLPLHLLLVRMRLRALMARSRRLNKILLEVEHLIEVHRLLGSQFHRLTLMMHSNTSASGFCRSNQLGSGGFYGTRRRRNVAHLVEAGTFADLVRAEAFGRARLLLMLIVGRALRWVTAICAAVTEAIDRLSGS